MTTYQEGERVIRVHTADGVVYARNMEGMPAFLGDGMLLFVELRDDVPAGLTQQEVVNHYRKQGCRVEQDHGTDFDNPEWGP